MSKILPNLLREYRVILQSESATTANTPPFVLDAEYFFIQISGIWICTDWRPSNKIFLPMAASIVAHVSVPPFEPGSLSSEAAPVKACRWCCQKSSRHTGSVSHLVSCGTPPHDKSPREIRARADCCNPKRGKVLCSSSRERYITYRQTGGLFSWPSVSKNSPKPLDGGPQKISQDAVAHPLG